ncbi:amino acid permease [Acinetobacter nectaris]|uniref:amino acid permease n=1 Tax=Acinetobacter nectaris TaxID=1219382 RepID=UPI001F01B2F9|nr:amino acid permease [Acinetobacter nectaris]MCF8999501.1 amino acid permease [Acinetobacter nectaris]MCF9028029.1 amino acid permease [Acinetobacter nectaris]
MQDQHHLKKKLSNRHIQLIALGGAIGTGLFLGISQTIQLAGPSVILGYGIAGFIAFLIMRQLGEMIVENPVSGSFSQFAFDYWGKLPGFISGWNYWILYILVGMAELSAIGVFINYWWPDFPKWASALIFFMLINIINFISVKFFGEMEFSFSCIKIIAILCMIFFGIYLLISGAGGEHATITNLWALGGFFPNGFHGLVMAMAAIMFAFGGLELLGISAAETASPEKTLPKAINQVVYRVLIFYIGSIAVLLSLYPWSKVAEGGSPFVMIFHSLNSNLIAGILNFVVLTAAVSVYNSCVYSNSRMLLGLAQQGNAPKALGKINSRGIPVHALVFSSLCTVGCVAINYFVPDKAFSMLMLLVVAALIINWLMISITHLKFRNVRDQENKKSKFPSFLYPFTNYITIVFVLAILAIMLFSDGMRIAVFMLPIWLAVLSIAYIVKEKKA